MAERVGFEPTDGFTRQTISSRSRYDLFDTAPYEIRGRKRPENPTAAQWRKSVEIDRNQEERKREFPKSHGDFRSSAEKKSTRFRVVLVMTSSIPLHMKLWGCKRPEKELATKSELLSNCEQILSTNSEEPTHTKQLIHCGIFKTRCYK